MGSGGVGVEFTKGGGGIQRIFFCNLSLGFEMDWARPYTRFAKFPYHSLDKC